MNLHWRTIISISRPRFWIYLAGPFVIGYVAGMSAISQLLTFQFWFYFAYFLVPTNIFLYGINDLADTDTDQFNSKKNSYEHSLQLQHQQPLQVVLSICAVLTLLLAVQTQNMILGGLLVLLLCLSFAYSSSPFRWKAHPLIDSASNILYVVPGIFAYYLVSGKLPPLLIIVAAGLWTAAMHLFSAIPDIKADAKVKLRTTAVVIGKLRSVLLCSGLWWVSTILLYIESRSIVLLLFSIYGIMPLLCLNNKWPIEKMYRSFPYINITMGFILFWMIVIKRFL